MRKGFGPLLMVIVVLAFVSALFGLYYFTEKKVFNKRVFEEKILSTGNEIETYTRIISSASDLATIQAIHDVGQNVIVYDNYEYNPKNYLPYWDSISKDKIKNEISRMSLIYMKNYENAYDNFFEEKNKKKVNLRNNIEWKIIWPDDSDHEINFNENYIENNFGIATIQYERPFLNITKQFPIESSINIEFEKILDIGNEVIEKVNNGENIEDIESEYNDKIKVELEQNNGFVLVSIHDEKLYPLYDPVTNEPKLDHLGLKFLVETGNAEKVSPENLDIFHECKNGKIISSNENICELYLT